jgi:restriction system protein
MSIPDFETLMRPLLALCKNSEVAIRDCIDQLAEQFALSADERAQRLPSGTETVFANRVHWARTYMGKAGLLERTGRGRYRATQRGLEVLAKYPERIGTKVLRQFPEFVEFYTAKPKPKEGLVPEQQAGTVFAAEKSTPEERIDAAYSEITRQLRSNLLDQVIHGSPAFFEKVVVDLIVAMGYGGSREDAARRLGRSGDEGIDGVVNEDPLGLDVVYIQAKRYAPGNVIGREKIQQFAGSLIGRGASKGVFVTTSRFTSSAIEYAEKIPQRLILIDGEQLTELMVRYGVGVRTEQKIEVRKIDLDYFSEGELD